MALGQALLQVLDQVGCGALLLDGAGRVLRLNEGARRSIEKHFTRTCRSGESNAWATEALRHLLGNKIRSKGLLHGPTAQNHDTDRPLLAHAISFSGDEEFETLLVLIDLAESHEASQGVLRDIFGLTKAEARVAARISCGETLQDIACAHHVSVQTARMQLKSIFAKTHTRRQAELVALLSRLALHPDGGPQQSDPVATEAGDPAPAGHGTHLAKQNGSDRVESRK